METYCTDELLHWAYLKCLKRAASAERDSEHDINSEHHNELCHEKTCFMCVQTTKVQISLHAHQILCSLISTFVFHCLVESC